MKSGPNNTARENGENNMKKKKKKENHPIARDTIDYCY